MKQIYCNGCKNNVTRQLEMDRNICMGCGRLLADEQKQFKYSRENIELVTDETIRQATQKETDKMQMTQLYTFAVLVYHPELKLVSHRQEAVTAICQLALSYGVALNINTVDRMIRLILNTKQLLPKPQEEDNQQFYRELSRS